jgi:membrane-bound ClpP family serine protease
METTNTPQSITEKQNRKAFKRTVAGTFLITIGLVWFAKKSGADIPEWLFTWPMLLVVIGLYSGIKHGFRGAGWLITIGIGTLFLLDHNIAGFSMGHYMWPVIIIAIGLSMLFRPRRHYRHC